MKKACVYLLLSLLLFNSSLGELCKLPKLYAHFMEHKNQDKNMGLLDFLGMHYGGDDQNSKDQDRDMELPFKKIDSHSFIEVVWLSSGQAVLSPKNFPAEKRMLLPVRNFNLADPSLASLFKPPIA